MHRKGSHSTDTYDNIESWCKMSQNRSPIECDEGISVQKKKDLCSCHPVSRDKANLICKCQKPVVHDYCCDKVSASSPYRAIGAYKRRTECSYIDVGICCARLNLFVLCSSTEIRDAHKVCRFWITTSLADILSSGWKFYRYQSSILWLYSALDVSNQ